MKRSRRWTAALWVWAGCVGLFGATIVEAQPSPPADASLPTLEAAAFDGEGGSAARAFADGNPAESARRYEVLLETRGPSPALLYNLGTAASFSEDYGRAIWALERARLLDPRNDDIQHNLDVTRQRVRVRRMQNLTTGKLTDGEPDGVVWFRTLTWATEGEIGLLIVLLNLLTFGALALRRRLPEGGLRDGAGVLVGLLAILLTTTLAFGVAQSWARASVRVGVILDADVPLHVAPSATAEHKPHPDLFNGATVRILDQRSDGWTQIQVVDGKTGWLLSNKLGEVR